MADREVLENVGFDKNGVMRKVDPFALIRDGIRALSERVYAWVVLLMAFGLFAWTVLHPDWLRLAAACGFTLLVLVPLAWRER